MTQSQDTRDSDGGAAPAGPATLLLADLARAVIASAAPEQLELLERIPARWTDGGGSGRGRRGWAGGSVSSGIDPAVLSEIVYPLLTGAFAQVLGTAALTGWQQRRTLRRLGRRSTDTPVAQVQLNLDAAQADRLRAACLAHGETLGLTAAEAGMLADALYGALRQTLNDDPQQRP
ncbi:hypothetical protein ACEZDB_33700 [Streptacidiphilus sp. N1-3]|uniref:DUF222 domain-containing protein n=1 Tax=Streptacidiphilus alkalitolerans TaxID=3342712 RepID=A0ABV6XBE6_9ACTN